ncbi:MAG: hypothetical protein R3234_12360, partial [Thermoanaerobaculia bacterium]|nr:hypothetical protein [Thermoanaerobaculia bacterium]
MKRSSVLSTAAVFVFLSLLSGPGARGAEPEEPPHYEFLPPLDPWDGASRELAVAPGHPWATPFEEGGMVDSPS